MIRLLMLAMLVLSTHVSWAQPTLFDIRKERLVPRSMKLDEIDDIVSAASAGPGLVWQTEVPLTIPVGSAIRVHIKVVSAEATSTWRVVVRDSRRNEVETVDGAVLAAEKEWWTDDVPTGRALIELWVDQGAKPEIVVDKYMFRVTPATDQGVIGRDNTLSITDPQVPQHVRAQGPAVARLRFVVPDGEGLCTGFLVGPDLLMTNEHCISDDDQVRGAIAEFNYDRDQARTKRVRITKVEATDFGLDYSLLRLKSVVTGQGRMFLDAAATAQDARLFVIQHPEGKPKRAAFFPDCGVGLPDVDGRAAQTDFKHICDTKPGSSGSPVLDWNTRRVVGLHHLGYPPGQEKEANQAVHIRKILPNLKGQVSDAVFLEVTRLPK